MAAVTYYVDPLSGDNATGDGSSGTPWKTIQYALDNGTWSTAGSDLLKVANTAADVLVVPLSCGGMSTVPSTEHQLMIEGWDNGGSLSARGPFGTTITPVGEIDGNDVVASILSVQSYVHFRNMKIHSTTSTILRLGSNTVTNCEIYNGGGGSLVRTTPFMFNTYVHQDVAGSTICIYQCTTVQNCETNGGLDGIQPSAPGMLQNNLVRGFTTEGIDYDENSTVVNNTVDGYLSNSDAKGITCTTGDEGGSVYNNLVVNLTGATAKAIYLPDGCHPAFVGNNAFYNNTTDVDVETPCVSASDIIESSDPFTDRDNGDYTLVSGASSLGASIVLNSDPDNASDVGALQSTSDGGGGGSTGVPGWIHGI